MRKKNTDFSSFSGWNFASELKQVLSEYQNQMLITKENALDKAADYMQDELKSSSPVDQKSPGQHLKDSWLNTKRKYKAVRYIGNTKTNNKGIPLTPLLEFSSKGHPFIRSAFNKCGEKIYKIIKGELSK